MEHASVETRFGRLTVTAGDTAITALRWGGPHAPASSDLLRKAVAQIAEYDAGTRTAFDLPMALPEAPFQRAVCAAMAAIPFGRTRTYGEIANDLGQSAQAVGRACGANPLPILIPCHRVMGANDRLTGYSGAGGVETKVALLRHEGAAGLLI